MKTLQISDLFFSEWQQLHSKKAYRVLFSQRQYKAIHDDQNSPNNADLSIGGYHLKNVLKACAKPRKWSTIKKLDPAQLVDIYHDLFIHTPFTEFFVKRLSSQLSGLALVAPDQALANMSFGQFKYADHEFSKMAMALEVGDLTAADLQINRLVATLYVVDGDVFDRNLVDQLARQIDRFAFPWQKELVVEAYANTRQNLMDRCPNLFPQPAETKDHDTRPPVQATGPMWHDMHYDIAIRGEAFKDFDSISAANIYDLIDYLEKVATETKET